MRGIHLDVIILVNKNYLVTEVSFSLHEHISQESPPEKPEFAVSVRSTWVVKFSHQQGSCEHTNGAPIGSLQQPDDRDVPSLG